MAVLAPNTFLKFRDLKKSLDGFFEGKDDEDETIVTEKMEKVFEKVETPEEAYFIASETLHIVTATENGRGKYKKFGEIFKTLKSHPSFDPSLSLKYDDQGRSEVLIKMQGGLMRGSLGWFNRDAPRERVVSTNQQLENVKKYFEQDDDKDESPLVALVEEIQAMFSQPLIKSANFNSAASIKAALIQAKGNANKAAQMLMLHH
jgi:hypothetical protein